jgi:hypothetical protein
MLIHWEYFSLLIDLENVLRLFHIFVFLLFCFSVFVSRNCNTFCLESVLTLSVMFLKKKVIWNGVATCFFV